MMRHASFCQYDVAASFDPALPQGFVFCSKPLLAVRLTLL
jgi:hypothetical protein